MTEWIYSIVLIVPTAQRADANALAAAMGWGPDNYAVPLSSGGTEPVSHFGLVTVCKPDFVAMLAGAQEGQMPQELIDADYPPAAFAAVVESLIADPVLRSEAEGKTHLDAVLGAQGLQRIFPEIEP